MHRMDIPTDRQIRAARALLGWRQVELAERAVDAETVVKRVERGKAVRSAMLRAICAALADAGISFTANDGGYGVRVARAASDGATITTGAGRSGAVLRQGPKPLVANKTCRVRISRAMHHRHSSGGSWREMRASVLVAGALALPQRTGWRHASRHPFTVLIPPTGRSAICNPYS